MVVSNEGEFVREFGRLGDGPGEFSASSNTAIGFTVLRDGRVVVFDPGHSVFQVFAPDGEFDRSVRVPGTSMYLMRTLAPARDGQSVITTSIGAFGMGGSSDDPEPPFRPIYRLSLTGDEAVQDTAIRAWRPSGDPGAFRPALVARALPDGGSDGPIDLLTQDGRYWAPSRPMRLRCHQPSVPMDWLLSESGTTSMYPRWS